ncbi:efflux RND transporter periplasmic adaptor subunit [Silvibacterium dinghuense]|uniref:Efflux RND transporter periplasmic adaptor subunit n=1 Tax=Silvibacterium dinghuense TaxID=1560006 RepID=A0A4Q1SD96_9BACT|nr:efflux RND transporter periplasmic adaptor subunit [Silvibacterium dinghuense]RXS95196.1 efflux RND transporter periplasmic adaptor subunit [Silvibacterium dinghuense]GGH11450.1 secretion protein HlyD [Silvibacterium dinghuense]
MTPRKRTVLFGSLTAVSALLAACSKQAAPTEATPTVPVAAVGYANLQNDLVLTAEFHPYQDVDVMAKVAGYVRQINVDIGDHVHQGQILATLEVPEIQDDLAKAKAGQAAAEANIATAEAAVEHARAAASIASLSYQRIEDVANRDRGLVPKQEVDVAQSRKAEASAQLDSAVSSLKAAQQARLEADSEYSRADAMVQYATIRAPFTGVVTKRYANTGSMIQAGISSQTQAMPLVSLAQNDLLRLILPVPVSDVSSIHNGEAVDVDVVSLGRTLKGTVTRYADSVQFSTRTMDTEVDVPNPQGTLVPGMYAEVHLHLAPRPHVLSVPVDAVDGIGTAAEQAWVIRDGALHLVPVTTGLQTPNRIEILSGLAEGDQIAVGRHTGLSDGEHVNPVPATYESASADRH